MKIGGRDRLGVPNAWHSFIMSNPEPKSCVMAQTDDKKKDLQKDVDKENEDTLLPPDPETLHKTDPQENMKGPVSSLMHNIEETMEKNDQEKPEDKK